jgi:hypothetical protein
VALAGGSEDPQALADIMLKFRRLDPLERERSDDEET